MKRRVARWIFWHVPLPKFLVSRVLRAALDRDGWLRRTGRDG